MNTKMTMPGSQSDAVRLPIREATGELVRQTETADQRGTAQAPAQGG
jgi:hypothetical protein